MPLIKLETVIYAEAEICFDLSRDIDLHQQSMAGSNEKAVAGVTGGLIGYGQEVSWRARHFGIPFHMTVVITDFEPPYFFADKMIKGPFKVMEHKHSFRPLQHSTLMLDEFYFEATLGVLGRLVSRWLLVPYLKKLLMHRNEYIKNKAERRP